MRWLVGKALTKEQTLEQPSQYYILLDVTFDYNWETFVPTKLPPAVVRKKDFPFLDMPDAPSKTGEYKHTALINFEGMFYGRLVTFQQNEIDWQVQNNTWIAADASWDKLRDDIQADCQLSSSVFAKFPEVQERNINKQVYAIRSSEPYKTFLPCALHMQTTKPLHLTHVVVIQFEFGYGLGEIKRLVDYKVMPVKELLDDMQRSGNFTPQMMAMYRNDRLNLALLQDPPKKHVMRAVFWNTNLATKYAFVFVPCSPMAQCPPEELIPQELIHGLDLKAKQDFAKVQALELPSVELPAIN